MKNSVRTLPLLTHSSCWLPLRSTFSFYETIHDPFKVKTVVESESGVFGLVLNPKLRPFLYIRCVSDVQMSWTIRGPWYTIEPSRWTPVLFQCQKYWNSRSLTILVYGSTSSYSCLPDLSVPSDGPPPLKILLYLTSVVRFFSFWLKTFCFVRLRTQGNGRNHRRSGKESEEQLLDGGWVLGLRNRGDFLLSHSVNVYIYSVLKIDLLLLQFLVTLEVSWTFSFWQCIPTSFFCPGLNRWSGLIHFRLQGFRTDITEGIIVTSLKNQRNQRNKRG